MNEQEFQDFLDMLDGEVGELKQEPHVEQTEQGRYEDLMGYFSRYMSGEEAARCAESQINWERTEYGMWRKDG